MAAKKILFRSVNINFMVLLLLSCSPLEFFTDEDRIPMVFVQNTSDSITVGDSYSFSYTLYDDEDAQQDLTNNLEIWIQNEIGETENINTFSAKAGLYTVFLCVTDSDGNKSDTVKIVVYVSDEDITSPVITLKGPAPFLLNVGDVYYEPGAKAVDNFDGDISGQIEISGDVNTLFSDTVTLSYTASDKASNSTTVTRQVIIKDIQGNDMQKPVIALIGDNPMVLLTGDDFNDPGATATDNIDGDLSAMIKVFGDSFTTAVADTYIVYYTVEDAAGNVATASRRVDIIAWNDTIAPVITLKGANPLVLAVNESYKEPGATASDNVDGDLSSQIVINDDSVITGTVGVYAVHYSVSDAAGNEAKVKRVVTVGIIDTIPPTIFLIGPNPMKLDYKGSYTEFGAYARDNVDDSIGFGYFVVDKNIDVNVLGNYTATYTVSDKAGNSVSAVRAVEVVDTIAPKIKMNGANPVNLGLNFPYKEFGATALDNYDGDMTSKLDTSGTVNVTIGGTYEITYQVTDSHGNKAVAVRVVNVAKDTKPPVIKLLGANPLNLVIGQSYVEPGATAYDSIDGDISSRIVIDKSNLNLLAEGTYQVKYTVSDTGGNTATANRSVVVKKDTQAPTLTLKGLNPMNVLINNPYNEPGATASDNIEGDISSRIVIDTTGLNTIQSGNYTVKYTVTDLSGNKAEKTRTVVVSSTDNPPVITLLGANPMTLNVGQSYTEPGATAIDDLDGDITNKIQITGTVNTATAGTYTKTYKVSDNAGHESTKTREVVVSKDAVPPVITLKGANPMTLEVGDVYTEPGATAVDDVDGDVSSNIAVTGTVTTSTAGTYTRTYTVSDKAGNQATKTRTVQVNTPLKITIEINKTYTISAATIYTIHADSLPNPGDWSYNTPIHLGFSNVSGVFQIKVDINGTVTSMSAAGWSFDNVNGPSTPAVSEKYTITITPLGSGAQTFKVTSVQWY